MEPPPKCRIHSGSPVQPAQSGKLSDIQLCRELRKMLFAIDVAVSRTLWQKVPGYRTTFPT